MTDASAIGGPEWQRARLHVVTGKGGTGKTTVAAALAIALAARPGASSPGAPSPGAPSPGASSPGASSPGAPTRVLLAEVEGRQGISQTFDVPPLGTDETRIARTREGGEIFGLSVDAKAALLEYLQLFYKLGRAGKLLERFGAIDFATTIAPGVRDVLLIGKLYEANRRRRDGRHRGASPAAYDAIVMDAPPTGRIGRFLSVNSEVADLARVGPIHSQAESITELLESEQTLVHIVTLLEEMPVQETLEAIRELRSKDLRVGLVVVNMVRDPLLDEVALEQARTGRLHKPSITGQLVDAGVKVTPQLVDGLLEEAYGHAHRVDLESEQLALLQETGLPLVLLPALPEGVDSGSVRELADILLDELEEVGLSR